MEEEHAAQEARKAAREASYGAPFRYFTPIGETREIVIVDEMPDFFRHEHALMDRKSKRWDNYVPCIDTHANCPVCKVAERPSYFAMYLTIIDLSGYEGKDGWVEFSKKLLVVKPTQQKKIMRLYERHKTLRGMVLSMTRDDKESATIGNDIEFVEFMDEEELLTYETEYVDKEGKVHPIICHEPYDYDAIFPEMTEKQLRAVAGGREPEAGSRESNRRELGGDGDDAWDKEPAPRGTRTASRRPARDEQEEDVPAPSARRSARSAPEQDDAPAPTRRAGRAAPPQEEEQDDAPAPRTTRRGRAAAEQEEAGADAPWDGADAEDGQGDHDASAEEAPSQRRAPRSRAAAPEQDEAPAPRAGVAQRRASLRR